MLGTKHFSKDLNKMNKKGNKKKQKFNMKLSKVKIVSLRQEEVQLIVREIFQLESIYTVKLLKSQLKNRSKTIR